MGVLARVRLHRDGAVNGKSEWSFAGGQLEPETRAPSKEKYADAPALSPAVKSTSAESGIDGLTTNEVPGPSYPVEPYGQPADPVPGSVVAAADPVSVEAR